MSAETDAAAALHDVVAHIGGQPRPGQSSMAVAVAGALRDGRHLLVQAGTGTGKSFAYLTPALQHSLAGGERILVSTATLALQRQLISKDIPTVLDAIGPRLPRAPQVAVLKGRANYVCRLRLTESESSAADSALFDLPGRLEQQAATLRGWAERTTTGDRDDLPAPVDGRVWRAMSVTGRECVGRARCPVGETCFAETAREAAAAADLVVVNHTLLSIHLAGEVEVLPEFGAAIIDEAHELVARMAQASTESLSTPGLAEAARLAGGLLGEPTAQRWRDAAAEFQDAVAEEIAEHRGPDARIRESPARLVRALALVRDAAHAGLTDLAAAADAETVSRRQAAVAVLTEMHDRAGLLLREDAGLVRWSTPDPIGLSCAPLRVTDRLRDGLLGEATVVATSATLQLGGSFAALAAEWGLAGPGVDLGDDGAGAGPAAGRDAEVAARWAWTDVGSPFDYQRQAVLYIPRDLPIPGGSALADATLSRITALVRAAGGRTLVLASSWRAAEAITAHLRDAAIPGVSLLAQERGSPVGPLVASFAADVSSVLVGTLSLWQGVDVPGPACSCVIIDKIPFPRPDDPLLAARSDAAASRGASGFAAVSLPHAALLLAQGAGRLIRSSGDRGVVAILDPRIGQRSYGGYLLASLPGMWRTSDTAVVTAALQRLRTASDAT